MYDKLVYALVPSGVKSGKVYSVVGGDLTFTRATTATRINKDGFIEFVNSGVPRLNYPLVNGVVRSTPHLLLEPQRTNLVNYSEDFSSWTPDDVTFDSDAIIAPDGNQTADLIYENTVSSEHRVLSNSISFTSGSKYTISVFGKFNGRVLAFHSTNQTNLPLNATFDLEIGNVVSSASGDATIIKYPNGWYHCIVTTTSGGTGNAQVTFRTRDDDNNTSFVGDISKGMALWGAQVELGAYPTSYIPSFDGSPTSTRNAELATSATAELNDKAGVLYVEVEGLNDLSEAHRYITISDNTASNAIAIRFESDGTLDLVNYGPSLTSTIYTGEINFAEKTKIAVQYGTATSDYKVYINGFDTPLSGSFSAQIMTGLDTVELTYPTNTLPFTGKVNQVLVFNDFLTDDELETLTT